MDKIIFLDIDGPIISGNIFNLSYDCQINRTFMNTMALAYLRRLLMLTKAKLVINSSHNALIIDNKTIKDDLIRWGINREYFHTEWKTKFPLNQISIESENHYYINPRKLGVLDWLKENGISSTKWVVFDDENFIDSPGMIHVSYEEGIMYADFKKACEYFNVSENALLTVF